MCLEHEPVGPMEIARRLQFGRSTVRDWCHHRTAHFPPFPPPLWHVGGNPLWDWPLVEAWFDRTHRYAKGS